MFYIDKKYVEEVTLDNVIDVLEDVVVDGCVYGADVDIRLFVTPTIYKLLTSRSINKSP